MYKYTYQKWQGWVQAPMIYADRRLLLSKLPEIFRWHRSREFKSQSNDSNLKWHLMGINLIVSMFIYAAHIHVFLRINWYLTPKKQHEIEKFIYLWFFPIKYQGPNMKARNRWPEYLTYPVIKGYIYWFF